MTSERETAKVTEGVFAINKPPSLTSAAVLRKLQAQFNKSEFFAPWLAEERQRRRTESNFQKRRRRDKYIQVKLGHGGTLDPLATGVLIVGVGKGTKQLSSFLGGTKDYECTLLFGAATDTYDITGKVLERDPDGGSKVTRSAVEAALKAFRGEIQQRPPIYSALNKDGKRLYEYARAGETVDIPERQVEVKELEVVDWLVGESHDFRIPAGEAPVEEKVIAQSAGVIDEDDGNLTNGLKRKRDGVSDNDVVDAGTERRRSKKHEGHAAVQDVGEVADLPLGLDSGPHSGTEASADPQAAILGSAETKTETVSQSALPPAVRLKLSVSSGFYVRSLCHDLGKAVGSLGMMATLVRSYQGGYTLGQNVLEYEELEKGEEVWAPKLAEMLSEWQKREEGVLNPTARSK